MGLEWAHVQDVSQDQGLLIGGFGRPDLRRLALRVDVPKEPQNPRLMATFPVGQGAFERPLGKVMGLFQVASQQRRFAQPGDPERVVDHAAHGARLLHRLLQEGPSFRHTPSEGIGRP